MLSKVCGLIYEMGNVAAEEIFEDTQRTERIVEDMAAICCTVAIIISTFPIQHSTMFVIIV